MSKLIGVYKIKIGTKIYIGSSNDIDGRIKRHISNLEKNKHYNNKMQNEYNTHRELDFEIIEIVDDISKLRDVEQYYINLYESYNDENLNISMCSHQTIMRKQSEETKEKISNAMKGRKRSKESVEKTAAWFRGKPKSQETKEKIRQTLKGIELTDDHKEKIREGMKNSESVKEYNKRKKGKKLSQEHKEEISKSIKGKKHKLQYENNY